MSSSPDLNVLNDVATNTTLNNLLELLENRLVALDDVSDRLFKEDQLEWKEVLSTAIRVCTDHAAADEVIKAILQLQGFYLKYDTVREDVMAKRLERRYLIYLKNCLATAAIKTIQRYDHAGIGLFQDVLTKRGLIKTNYSLDGSVINKLKAKLSKGDKNNG